MKTTLAATVAAAALCAALPASAAVADLEGAWDNSGRANGGVAELDVTFDRGNATFRVRAAGSCNPRPCEFGETVGYAVVPPGRAVSGSREVERNATGFSAGYEDRDGPRQLIVTAASKGRLQVMMVKSYRDGRAAVITTETFTRSKRAGAGGGGGDYAEAQCTNLRANQLRIRPDGGGWTLTQDGRAVATFESADAAGFARWVVQSYDLRAKCTLPGDAGFEYWTGRNGAIPQGGIDGEFCREISGEIRAVQGRRGGWTVSAGRQALYETGEQGEAEAIAATLTENRPTAQCFIGEAGTGMSYFRR